MLGFSRPVTLSLPLLTYFLTFGVFQYSTDDGVECMQHKYFLFARLMGALHESRCTCRGPRSSAEDAALGEAMVASKREEMDREIDHLLIMQSENLRRYWEVSPLTVCCFCCLKTADAAIVVA